MVLGPSEGALKPIAAALCLLAATSGCARTTTHKRIAAKRIDASPHSTQTPSPTPRPIVMEKAKPTAPSPEASARVGALAQEPAPQGDIPQLIHAVFGPTHGPKAVRVARCESGLRPGAKSKGGEFYGLFQISARWHSWRAKGGSLLNPVTNTRVAHQIFLESGWRPWPVCGR